MTRTRRETAASRRARTAAEAERRRTVSVKAAEAATARLGSSTRSRGLTLQRAAPLVFQGMCRREGIRVFFTETPKTDGRSIWLGPVNLMSPLAPVYVYGHGCHERHHVVYTDFRAMADLESPTVRTFANALEDIRVDRLGASDYEGYLLWREALFTALEESGAAPWLRASDLAPPALLVTALMLTLEAEVLGIGRFEAPAKRLRERASEAFGEETVHDVLTLVRNAMPLCDTAHAVSTAREAAALLERSGRAAKETFRRIAGRGLPAARPIPQSARADPQGSLFDEDGFAAPEAMPTAVQPGLTKARREAESFAALAREELWNGADGMPALRRLMETGDYANDDESFGSLRSEFADVGDYERRWAQRAEEMRTLFRKCWARSTALRRLFQSSLEHPLPVPERYADSGLEIDDRTLALLGAGEDRIFRKPVAVQGREIAVQILVDTSGSMDAETITFAKVTALRLLEAMRAAKGIRAALSLFPGATQRCVTPVARWDDPLGAAVRRLDFVEGYGATPILQALFTAAVELDERPEAAKAVFVITDGWFREDTLADMLDALEARGIAVAMAGIGPASTPCGRFHVRADEVRELPAAAGKLLADLSKWLRSGR
ncbi:MAG: vWA domain-containing protein [Sutterella sp.]|nr:vWA domain-containing protein [Sutterella sp.]